MVPHAAAPFQCINTNYRKRTSTASGEDSSKFTVRTVVGRYNCLSGVVEASLTHVVAKVMTEDWLSGVVEIARECTLKLHGLYTRSTKCNIKG